MLPCRKWICPNLLALAVVALQIGCASAPKRAENESTIELSGGPAVIAASPTKESGRKITIAVFGQVVQPGEYETPEGTTLLQAIALAGGFTDYAFKRRLHIFDGPTQLAMTMQYRRRIGRLPLVWYGDAKWQHDFVLKDKMRIDLPLCCF